MAKRASSGGYKLGPIELRGATHSVMQYNCHEALRLDSSINCSKCVVTVDFHQLPAKNLSQLYKSSSVAASSIARNVPDAVLE